MKDQFSSGTLKSLKKKKKKKKKKNCKTSKFLPFQRLFEFFSPWLKKKKFAKFLNSYLSRDFLNFLVLGVAALKATQGASLRKNLSQAWRLLLGTKSALLRIKTSFFFLFLTLDSMRGHRVPWGSLASNTSKITSAASTT